MADYTFESARHAYRTDPTFKRIVDQMMWAIDELQLTPADLRGAAMFAAYLHACRHPRSVLVRAVTPEGFVDRWVGMYEAATAEPRAEVSPKSAGARLLARADRGERFNAHLLLRRAANDPDLAQLTPRQVNDHLRRFAQAGKLRVVIRGKRGKAGVMPVYEFAYGKGSR